MRYLKPQQILKLARSGRPFRAVIANGRIVRAGKGELTFSPEDLESAKEDVFKGIAFSKLDKLDPQRTEKELKEDFHPEELEYALGKNWEQKLQQVIKDYKPTTKDRLLWKKEEQELEKRKQQEEKAEKTKRLKEKMRGIDVSDMQLDFEKGSKVPSREELQKMLDETLPSYAYSRVTNVGPDGVTFRMSLPHNQRFEAEGLAEKLSDRIESGGRATVVEIGHDPVSFKEKEDFQRETLQKQRQKRQVEKPPQKKPKAPSDKPKRQTPDEYRKEHGKCPSGYHFDGRKCVPSR